MVSEQSWKEKYLQALDSSGSREEQWQTERNTLERMLVRTSLASEGQAPELDKLLARVRKDLRKKSVDVEAWRELQEQIDRQVALLDECSEAEQMQPSPEPSPDSFKSNAETPPPAGPVPGDERDLADNTERLRIAQRVGQLLGQLLDQLTLDSDAEARGRELQRALLYSSDWNEVREGLNHVAELVITAVNRSRGEFEAFLKRLDGRLALLHEHFAEQSTAQMDRLSASETLDQDIREGMARIGADIRESEDLNQLKASVSQHLSSIGDAVGRFRDKESDREKVLSDQLSAMQEKIAVMEAHSEQLQYEVRRERERAMTDLLTQLPNREAWQERLSFEFNRWQRYRNELTIGLLDIDLFKRINDGYGHKAGDRVLQLISRELKAGLRTTDYVARYGGEEFVLLFPETGPDAALVAMEKLRQRVSKLPFHFSGEPVTVTFSAGLAVFGQGDSEETVFERADRALYLAKDAGRNCINIEGEDAGQ
ncbi:GGDEF domain-containing protein [Marinobacter alexandrii]|uniref:GGDEF domain-containing protein n=3 Tax=Marinobacter alexandrii TaxID=2570351 RepID=UPI0011086F1C|nr:GGDEF domain-containing protein [Marinobacter alexandrii]